MASTSSTVSSLSSILPLCFSSRHNLPLPLSFPHSNPPRTATLVLRAAAAKPQTGPVPKKKKKKSNSNSNSNSNSSRGRGGGGGGGAHRSDGQSKSNSATLRRRSSDTYSVDDGDDGGSKNGTSQYQSMPLPKPPAGFVLDDEGKVLTATKNRIINMVDPDNNRSLDCITRRVFRSSGGDECMLVTPADMPVSILKSSNFEGWTNISDEEVEAVLPTADYTLARIHMHLVYSGFCYTARGGFAYNESDLFNLGTDDGPTEALEIVCFHLDGSHYMVYTPVDQLNFVAVKDDNGVYRLADDELLEDPAVVGALDEETEFNALAQAEESALVEILNNGGL